MNIRFLKPKIEIESGKVYFNVLVIQNKSSKEIEFNINYNVPRSWIFIGPTSETIIIPPHDKINLPVHVTAAKDATGGVGYVVVAVVSDKLGTIFKTEYSFINIPIKTGLSVSPISRSNYFDHKTLTAPYNLKISNKGNIDEIVNVKLEPGNTISVGSGSESFHIDNFSVRSNKDTTVQYTVHLNTDDESKTYALHKMNISVSGEDTVISKIAWFKYVDWQFTNYIPETDYPLVVELTALNIFSVYKAQYVAHIYGKLLFKNKQSVAYTFENLNRSTAKNNIWQNSRFLVSYKNPRLELEFGDIVKNFDLNMYGRGLSSAIKITKRDILSLAVTLNQLSNIYNVGGSLKHQFPTILSIEAGAGYSKSPDIFSDTKLIYGASNLKFKQSSLDLRFGLSNTNFQTPSTIKPYNGYGYSFNYSGSIQSLKINLINFSGTPGYEGILRSRSYNNGILWYTISEKKNISLIFTRTKYSPFYLSGNEYIYDRYTTYNHANILYRYTPDNSITIFGGPSFNQEFSNSFSSFSANDIFLTNTGKAELSIKLNEKYSYNSVTLTGRYGMTFVNKFSKTLYGVYNPEIKNQKPYNIAEFFISVRRKYVGLNFIYYHGPTNISQQYSYFYTNYFSKTFYLTFKYERFFYKNILNLNFRASYSNNVTSKNSRVNFDTRINLFVKKGWEFHFTNTLSFQSRASSAAQSNASSQSNSIYTSIYFEVGLRKVFDFNQPRIKYMDLDAIFYKDLNGNRFHDPNEPGVGNVLVNINRGDPEADLNNPNYNGEFMSTELMSNPEGHISYKNMPEGKYSILYLPTGSGLGNYSPEAIKKEFAAENDTLIYIPFMERNKVFGKIILHRDKYSALGEIPLDNIKIYIEGNDKIYTTNTDKDGYFEAYIPVSDYYTVKVQNAFYENFSIRQEYYIVKFNGYKQFELTFEFDEKKREVKFDDKDFIVDENNNISLEDVALIRQTNLRGTVREEISQIPLHSKITIRNAENNDLISETVSSERTGIYFTTFFAGKNYTIKAETDGYWVYYDKLEINQITTFDNITRDILLRKINQDEKLRTENLTFYPEKSDLSTAAQAELDNILSLLFMNPTVKVEISGHADDVEAIKTNAQKLSDDRAKAIANYLKSHGLPPQRLEIVGRASTSPVSNDASEAGRAKNRRVELKVLKF